MKYETPELTALTPAINAIQQTAPAKGSTGKIDGVPLGSHNETNLSYQDWED